jgi:hypothetical protein
MKSILPLHSRRSSLTKIVFSILAILTTQVGAAFAGESAYSKLDFDKHCVFEEPESEDEAGTDAKGICQIHGFPIIYFAEGDLRQSMGFGARKEFESFSQWNFINTTVEWRKAWSNSDYHATILRWFIENLNPETGSPDESRKGQILVVSKVAVTEDGETCVVGMVDARANSNANALARSIADEIVPAFRCGIDQSEYYGKVGKYIGSPVF